MQNKKTPFVTKQQVEEIVKTYPPPYSGIWNSGAKQQFTSCEINREEHTP